MAQSTASALGPNGTWRDRRFGHWSMRFGQLYPVSGFDQEVFTTFACLFQGVARFGGNPTPSFGGTGLRAGFLSYPTILRIANGPCPTGLIRTNHCNWRHPASALSLSRRRDPCGRPSRHPPGNGHLTPLPIAKIVTAFRWLLPKAGAQKCPKMQHLLSVPFGTNPNCNKIG